MDVITRADARLFTNVRLVGEGGTNEVVHILDALKRADEEGLDLCVVSDKSNPPVVKVQDFKKVQYEIKKSRNKKTRSQETKEVQLKVNISDHDLTTKTTNIKKFLERGDKVKVTVRLFGRERENPERARQLLERVTHLVPGKFSALPGPIAIMIIEPLAAKISP